MYKLRRTEAFLIDVILLANVGTEAETPARARSDGLPTNKDEADPDKKVGTAASTSVLLLFIFKNE